MDFDQLILQNIIKTAATRCHYFRAKKCTKFDFGWENLPVQCSPRLLAGFKGPTPKENGGE